MLELWGNKEEAEGHLAFGEGSSECEMSPLSTCFCLNEHY